MPKSRNANSRKPARKQARKSSRKSAGSTKPQRPVARASARGPKRRSPAAPSWSSKKAAIIALLERPNGGAISDLRKETGWQEHSVRAALTGLRKGGKELLRHKDTTGVTRYRLAAA